MNERLKPCPFCGGKAEIENINGVAIDGDYFMIECKNCFASVCFGDESETKAGAITAWNRRVEDERNIPKELIDDEFVTEIGFKTARCSNCKTYLVKDYPQSNYCPNCGQAIKNR